MGEAFFRRAAKGRHRARSAGTHPAEAVHPVVVAAMRELNVDLSACQPQLLTEELSAWADLVITMGCGEECPVIPGKRYIEWDLLDPADQPLGEVRAIRDDIRRRTDLLVRTLS